MAAGALAATLVLGGCTTEDPDGGTAPESPSGAASQSPSATATDDGGATPEAAETIAITIAGHEVSPNGERVEVPVSEPIALEVTADAAGSLHVHSDPEQEVAYEEGTHTYLIQIDRPGVVEVESHDTHQVVVQLEAR